MSRVRSFVEFVSSQFSIIRHSIDLGQQLSICEAMVDWRLRRGLVAGGVFDMSDIRGTFLVHLVAYITVVPSMLTSWASIKKPDGKIERNKGAGCDRFLNNTKRDSETARYPQDLDTSQARSVVIETI